MRNLAVPATGLALVIWLIGGTWWYVGNYCPELASAPIPTQKIPLLTISDNSEVIAQGPNFIFQTAQSVPYMTPATLTVLQRTSGYLNANLSRKLVITGEYSSKESETNHLGLARSNSIRDLLTSLGSPLTSVQTEAIKNDKPLIVNGQLVGPLSFTFQENATQENAFTPLNVYFGEGKYEIHSLKGIDDYLTSLKAFLDQTPGAKLLITGNSDALEGKAASMLSEKRALSVRQFLIKAGIDKSYLNTYEQGESMMIAAAGSEKNRRVEVRVLIP